MQEINIPFSETGMFSKLILDYVNSVETTHLFYNYSLDINAIQQAITDKQNEKIDRDNLVHTIQRQYANIELSDAVASNINCLSNSNSYCIVTAHQLNIFGGPLYYIYKIAQTISTCQQLKLKYPDISFVPIYWLGSEDHDFEEINHIYLYNKKIEWQDKQGGATGNYNPESILPLIDEIKSILHVDEDNDLIQLFRSAYAQNSLTNATRYLLHSLFGKYGLVIVDGNDASFKQAFSDVMQDELLQQQSITLVEQQLQLLASKGYKQQAFPRAINLFYLFKNARERIEFNASTSTYSVVNTNITFLQNEIIDELKNNPERFSPNVILRPLFQQKILPALAYIGGAGEISYWLQLKTLFQHYKVNFPQLIVRNSVLLINDALTKKAMKLGFTTQDFLQEIDSLKKLYIEKNTATDLDFSNYKHDIEKVFNEIKNKTQSIDVSLVNVVGAEQQKTLQSIDAIQKRLLKSLKQKNENELLQIEKLKQQLFPNQSLQERVENFSSYYVKYGQSFIDELIQRFDVYNKQFLLLTTI